MHDGEGAIGRLTVIIPTHGRPAGLAAALGSLAQATRPAGGMRVVVVADGEQAHAAAVVAAARREGLEVELRRQAHRGPAAARNRGAEGIRAGAVAFLDDDCRAAPGWPVAVVAALREEPRAIVGGPIVNGCPGLPAAASQLVYTTVVGWARAHDPRRAYFASMNMAMTAATFAALGGFDEAFSAPAAEDRDLCERATLGGRRLVAATEAFVVHEHQLNAASLWRQHRAYGRGAVHLRAARDRRGQGSPGPHPGLYVALVRAALASGSPGRTVLAVILTQVAYLTGVLAEIRAGARPRSG